MSDLSCSLSRTVFAEGVSTCLRALSKNSPGGVSSVGVRVAAGIRVTVIDSVVVLSATDTNESITVAISCSQPLPGEVMVPGKLLHDVVGKIPGSTILLSYDDSRRQLILKGEGRTKFRLATMSADDYPEFSPMPSDSTKISLDPVAFQRAVAQIVPAVAAVDHRPVLRGTLWDHDGTTLHLAATDGYRMVVREMKTELTTARAVVVPGRMLADIAKALDSAESVAVEFSTEQVAVEIIKEDSTVKIISRLIEGAFPNWRSWIPKNNHLTITMNKKEILLVLQRLAIIAQELTPMRMIIEPDSVTISIVENEIGDAEDVIESAVYSGERFVVGIGPKYFHDCISAMDGDTVTLAFAGPGDKVLITSPDHPEVMAISMPQVLKGE